MRSYFMLNKKVVVILLVVLAFLIALFSIRKNSPVESTNLKDITVNSISLNDNISAYEDKLVEEKDNDWDYSLNGAKIFVDKDGIVTKIVANEDSVLSRKDIIVESDYEKLESLLGTNYRKKIYDYSQGMKEHIYYDRDNNIQLEVVYYEGASGKQIAFIVMSNCGKNSYPALPDNAMAFEMGTFEDAAHDSALFGTLEYDGRTYIGFGTVNNKFRHTAVDRCIGYVVMDENSSSNPDPNDTNTRIYTLSGDTDHNFLMDYNETAGPMNQPNFWRALDTRGEDIEIPKYIDDLGYEYWKSAPVVNVKLELKGSSEVQYVAIYEDGSTEVLNEAFAIDDAEVFIADVNNFSASTESGKVVNELISTVVMDGDGNETTADEALGKLLQAIADTIQHDILEAKIFKDGQIYYVAVQTNVNWQSPCDFYRYDPSDGKLTNLCSWDDVNVLGVLNK